MLRCKTVVVSVQCAVGSLSGSGRLRLRRALCVLLLTAFSTLLTTSCRRDMQDQPKMKPLRSSSFFKDGLSSRPPVEGTVPRGFLNADTEYFTGKKAGRSGQGAATPQPRPQSGGTTTGAAAFPDDVEVFPIEVTEDLVRRGRERYDIFCSACHGFTGHGDGMVVRRGFRRATSFHDEKLRQAPVGHFFDAVTNGWGAMPSYAHQIPVKDRWAIIAYIRALQLRQANQSQTTPAVPAASPTPHSGGHQ
jgi:mono/diheme cytochrome c family protein